eukprot:TRINITY_DN7695_c0_g5_i1.p1 TRINITY_DN7695_c0_g5~~TRINITY_DN7695_c0_g5_i1.p1  ORF type:complete len:121 (-),score=13.01 TRINITY_DN7695_c0_g5_i1:265-627(-)
MWDVTVQAIPGKGLGLVADVDVEAGDMVISVVRWVYIYLMLSLLSPSNYLSVSLSIYPLCGIQSPTSGLPLLIVTPPARATAHHHRNTSAPPHTLTYPLSLSLSLSLSPIYTPIYIPPYR